MFSSATGFAPLHLHKLRDWDVASAVRLALFHVLRPGGIIQRVSIQQTRFLCGGFASSRDDLFRFLILQRVEILQPDVHHQVGPRQPADFVACNHHVDRAPQNGEKRLDLVRPRRARSADVRRSRCPLPCPAPRPSAGSPPARRPRRCARLREWERKGRESPWWRA